jgi:hypothetical protein
MIDPEDYGYAWDVCEEWWPEGLWMKICLECKGGPINDIADLCMKCQGVEMGLWK